MTPRAFQPIVKFVEQTDADRLAINVVHTLQAEIRKTMDTERSKKTTIGISEIGDPCDRCVCRKLSGLYAKPSSAFSDGWKAQIGTFGHAGLEQHFGQFAVAPDALGTSNSFVVDGRPLEVHLERRVSVYSHEMLELDGSCDLFITDGRAVEGGTFGIVGDWKFQGPKVIAETQKGKVKPVYVVQQHTYALGYELLGYPVTHVVLYALPRDGELDDAAPVLARYDRDIALNALARIEGFLEAAKLLEQAYPGEGWERLIRAQGTASGCFTCRSYDTAEGENFFSGWLQ